MDGWESPGIGSRGVQLAGLGSLNDSLSLGGPGSGSGSGPAPKKKSARRGADPANQKRRCVSTACIACRKRKSKCDGALPSCAACSSVYGTECIYDPNSDHRRKGVYREKIDSMKAQSSTLQVLIEAILNAEEEDVPAIVKRIRTCDSLDTVAEAILKEDFANDDQEDETTLDEPDTGNLQVVEGERELARKMGELRLENGSVRFIGGTSHLIYLGDPNDKSDEPESDTYLSTEDPITSWSEVTKDPQVIIHLINLYFNWHYPFFTTLSKSLFYRDFLKGKPTSQPHTTSYCSSLLVNAMLALGCHFTSIAAAHALPGDSRTKGDHFFAEAKRLIIENDEYEKPKLTTVQTLALMSVREAGCGREAKGWVYSGMSFRMAQDIGLNLDLGGIPTLTGDSHHHREASSSSSRSSLSSLNDQEIDARRITFWGCFLFDKCWSNYLGRLPQIPKNTYNVPKYDVFPDEDAALWSPYTDNGFDESLRQPSRTRAVALQLTKLCEISSDLLLFFYHPNHIGRSSGKSVELKKLSELHRRLEEWRKELPKELEPKEGQLPHVILVHMFFHLQYIHLFRPFLKYNPSASPLPSHVSPRRICSANAGAISKLMRLYKKTYNLRQICNIAVYMVHSACTIHMLNLPEKTARRDMTHGVRQLEEIAEDWPCARRTLGILSVLARKWGVEMPDEAAAVLRRTDEKYGTFSTSDVPSPNARNPITTPSPQAQAALSAGAHSQHAASQSPVPKLEHYSPVTHQFNHPTPPAAMDTPEMLFGSLSPDLLAMAGQMHQHQNQNPAVTSAASMSMSDALSAVTGNQNPWGHQPQPQPPPRPRLNPFPNVAATSAQQQYTPLTSVGGSGSSNSGTRQVSPSSLYAIDGSDWYLKDGVSWQQNFEAWNAATTTSSSTPGSAGIGGGGDQGGMFMFHGLGNGGNPGQGGEFDNGGGGGGGGVFDSLNMSSMDDLDHLPGLD